MLTPKSPDHLPDLLLVKKCKEGDRGAFEILVLKYHRQIINLCHRLTNEREAAEDLAQEVFLKAFRAIGSFREDASFYTWLYRIAVNVCLTYRSSTARKVAGSAVRESDREEGGAPLEFGASEQTPEKKVLQKELGTEIRKALEGLPDDFRSPLLLREIDGLSYDEIGEILNLPAGTVKSRIFRGREELKKKLAHHWRK